MVNGHNKARALQQAVEGAVNQMWTITALQLHPKGIIVCDEAACADLKVGTYNYFKDIEKDTSLSLFIAKINESQIGLCFNAHHKELRMPIVRSLRWAFL